MPSKFKKVNNWLHKWLGLISGIVVFIVCITGCMWVFQEEIIQLTEPELNIQTENRSIVSPSHLHAIAQHKFPEKKLSSAYYKQGRAIEVTLGERRQATSLYVHPYSGTVIGKKERKEGETGFFRWVLNGHRFLWLPHEIGRPLVNYSVLIFVFILISGLVWWYPKKWTKKSVKRSFKIKWSAPFKRLNIDLHNVLGFYASLFLLAIACTGMVWGIEWFSKTLYWTTSGGEFLPEWNNVTSDTTQVNAQYTFDEAIDKAWKTIVAEHPHSEGFYISFPDTADAKSTLLIIIYPSASQIYKSQRYTFDQHTLQQLSVNPIYETTFEASSFGTKLRKMNFEIHVGSILGFPGKVLAFLSSLIGASLPITGFIIWWKKRKKNTKIKKQPSSSKPTLNSRPQIKKPKIPIPVKKQQPH